MYQTYQDEREVALWFREDFLCALDTVHHRLHRNADFAEEFQDHHLVDSVVFDQQNTLVFLAQSCGQFREHLLLVVCDLLGAVLVAVCAHLAALLRIEYDCEARWLEWLEDEEDAALRLERLIIMSLGLLEDTAFLSKVCDDNDCGRRVCRG